MQYINTKTLEYPLTERQIRLANPTVSYGRPFNPKGYAPVYPEKVAHDPATQKIVPGAVVQIDGKYIEQRTVVDMTLEEIAANQTPFDKLKELKTNQAGQQLSVSDLKARIEAIETILGVS